MKGRIYVSRATMFALAAIAAMMVLGTTVASAIPWNPPCGNTRVVNNTACNVGICPLWNPGIPIPCSPIIGPGGVSGINTAFPALQLNGIVSWGGFVYPLQPAPALPCGAGSPFWVPAVTVGPAGCCVDIFIDPATCTITVCPSPGPCRP
jgi:hypothetical protein